MLRLFASLYRFTKKHWKTKPATRRTERTVRLGIEQLEAREVMAAVTDMTALAQLFPRHAGPTTLYLNFDGYAAEGVSSFVSTSGNRYQDIHDILYRTSEIFAPFDVQVRRISGDGNMSIFGGNTTIFIGDNSEYGTGADNDTGGYCPWESTDYPGDARGFDHRPNSDPYDIAYVDPVSAAGSSSNAYIAGSIAHEAGHSFGLTHVLSSPDPEVMSYDAAYMRFVDKTFNITDLNRNGNENVSEPRMVPLWDETQDSEPYDRVELDPFLYVTSNPIMTQNSYTYLRAVLGAPTTYGADVADVADRDAVDPSYRDGEMPTFSIGSTVYSARSGINHYGDFDVASFSTPTSKWVTLELKQDSSSVDPVLMIYSSTGRTLLAFNDDSNGTLNSKVVFQAAAGRSYKIVIGSYGDNSTGAYQLRAYNSFGSLLTSVTTLSYKTLPVTNSTNLYSAPVSSYSGAGSNITERTSDPLVLPAAQIQDAVKLKTPKRLHIAPAQEGDKTHDRREGWQRADDDMTSRRR